MRPGKTKPVGLSRRRTNKKMAPSAILLVVIVVAVNIVALPDAFQLRVPHALAILLPSYPDLCSRFA